MILDNPIPPPLPHAIDADVIDAVIPREAGRTCPRCNGRDFEVIEAVFTTRPFWWLLVACKRCRSEGCIPVTKQVGDELRQHAGFDNLHWNDELLTL